MSRLKVTESLRDATARKMRERGDLSGTSLKRKGGASAARVGGASAPSDTRPTIADRLSKESGRVYGSKLRSEGKRGKRLRPSMEAAYALARSRSGGVCQVCAQPATEVHHLRTRGAAAHLREDAANLCEVCSECHERWQKDGARFRQIFARDWPYFRAIYNAALDELKVGRLVGDVFVPLAALPHDVGEEGA